MKKHCLINLLALGLVLGLMALNSMPRWKEHRIRVKTFHVNMDMREIAAALDFYYADHQAYPPAEAAELNEISSASDFSFGYIPSWIASATPASTPDLARDIYSYRDRENYCYATNFNDSFIIIGRGPDGILQSTPDAVRRLFEEFDEPSAGRRYQFDYDFAFCYDPTNGIRSFGDMYRYSAFPKKKEDYRDLIDRPNKYFDRSF